MDHLVHNILESFGSFEDSLVNIIDDWSYDGIESLNEPKVKGH